MMSEENAMLKQSVTLLESEISNKDRKIEELTEILNVIL